MLYSLQSSTAGHVDAVRLMQLDMLWCGVSWQQQYDTMLGWHNALSILDRKLPVENYLSLSLPKIHQLSISPLHTHTHTHKCKQVHRQVHRHPQRERKKYIHTYTCTNSLRARDGWQITLWLHSDTPGKLLTGKVFCWGALGEKNMDQTPPNPSAMPGRNLKYLGLWLRQQKHMTPAGALLLFFRPHWIYATDKGGPNSCWNCQYLRTQQQYDIESIGRLTYRENANQCESNDNSASVKVFSIIVHLLW